MDPDLGSAYQKVRCQCVVGSIDKPVTALRLRLRAVTRLVDSIDPLLGLGRQLAKTSWKIIGPPGGALPPHPPPPPLCLA